MTEEILSLNQLKAAIKTATDDKGKKLDGGDAALDTLNKDLFQKKLVGGNVKQIQVLTNKPRSVYYVAVVVREHPPQRQAFDDAYIAAIGMGKRSDLFVAIAREIEAQEHIKALTKQLRDAADVQVKNAQGFD